MLSLQAFITKHEKIALSFSAGKDSAACLKLLRSHGHMGNVLVVWGNPGDPYPETRAYMNKVRASVPYFLEVCGNQPQFVKDHGWPADSVPFVGTPLGRAATEDGAPKIVAVSDCCGTNLWLPVYRAIVESGVTGIVRGEKKIDALKSTANGDERFCFPLYGWSDDDVLEFLGDDAPPSYDRLPASLDCMTCTAFLGHNPGRLADLKTTHPESYAKISPVVAWLRKEADKNLANLEAA